MNPKLIIGNQFPLNTNGLSFNVPNFLFLGNESSMLIWKINKPTKSEIEIFNYDKIKIGVCQYKKVGFLCVQHGDFGEGDASFHYSLTNLKDKHLMKINSTDIGLPVYMCLIDQKNILKALRCINLNKEITNYIASITEYQRTKEGLLITPQEYIETIQNAYKKYDSIEKMMTAAKATCEFKGKILNV